MFLEINCKLQSKSLKEIYKTIFSSNQKINVKFLENLHHDCLLRTTNKLVHFGWNKEAIPISITKKSLVARLFEGIFS